MKKIRKVRLWGNSWVIVLAPTDARDNGITEEGTADISDVIFSNKKMEEVNNEKTPINANEIVTNCEGIKSNDIEELQLQAHKNLTNLTKCIKEVKKWKNQKKAR